MRKIMTVQWLIHPPPPPHTIIQFLHNSDKYVCKQAEQHIHYATLTQKHFFMYTFIFRLQMSSLQSNLNVYDIGYTSMTTNKLMNQEV